MSTAEKEVARYGWLTTGDIAERQGVSAETVRAWIHMPGGLKAMNVGTKNRPNYRVRPDWLDVFVAGRMSNG